MRRGRLAPVAGRQHGGEATVRVMVLVKGDEASAAGVLPSEQVLTEMAAFNDELAQAGVMLDGGGLTPSSAGVRVRFSGTERTVVRGPFAEPMALIAGYWLWKVELARRGD